MDKNDYYFALEYINNKIVRIHNINVGVRHIGLNAHVRSMQAFHKFEQNRLNKHDSIQPSYKIQTSGQFHATSPLMRSLHDKCADKVEHASPKEFFLHIGYDRKRKRYVEEMPAQKCDSPVDEGQHDQIAMLSGVMRELKADMQNLQHYRSKHKEYGYNGERELTLAVDNIEQGIHWLRAAIDRL